MRFILGFWTFNSFKLSRKTSSHVFLSILPLPRDFPLSAERTCNYIINSTIDALYLGHGLFSHFLDIVACRHQFQDGTSWILIFFLLRWDSADKGAWTIGAQASFLNVYLQLRKILSQKPNMAKDLIVIFPHRWYCSTAHVRNTCKLSSQNPWCSLSRESGHIAKHS